MASPRKRENPYSTKKETGVAIVVNAIILRNEITATDVRNQECNLCSLCYSFMVVFLLGSVFS